MKKIYLSVIFSALISFTANVLAATSYSEAQTDDILDFAETPHQDDLLNDYLNELKDAEQAKLRARDIINSGLETVNLRDSQKKMIKEGDSKRQQMQQKYNIQISEEKSIEDSAKIAPPSNVQPDIHNNIISQNTSTISKIQTSTQTETNSTISAFERAPFGLYWNISSEALSESGYNLQPAQRDGYDNVYAVTNPKQNNQTFELITAIFGKHNHLWCIYAQSKPQKDTPNGSQVLELYHKYYDALKQKYGNAQEFFTPHKYPERQEDKNGKVNLVEKQSEIGGDDFLYELKNGTSSLFATFESDTIGVTLTVNVNEHNKSFISLDYKNLQIKKSDEDKNFNDLIDEL